MAKFSSGDPLQLVSHLLMFSDQGPREAAERFERTATALKKSKQRVWQSHYDEVALLVLSGGHVDEVVPRVIEYRDRLRAVKPRPSAEIAFSIAAGVVLAEEAERMNALEGATAAANLRAVQAIIEAQQAAIIACMAAVSVTTVGRPPRKLTRAREGRRELPMTTAENRGRISREAATCA